MTAEAFAPAKINLTLHVTGRRADGYHLLDSLVVFAGVGDKITATPAAEMALHVTGPTAAGVPTDGCNLVMKAARLMPEIPAKIVLEKHLPTAAGIGGGSSDAAATVRVLSALGGTPPEPGAILSLGADVPVCHFQRPARMSGIGNVIDPAPPPPHAYLVLVNPGVAISTADVFAALQGQFGSAMQETLPNWPDTAAFADWLLTQRNDLESPARTIAPVIDDCLATLSEQPFCLLARMSGSGATCFGLFDKAEDAQATAAVLAASHPDWWVAAAPILAVPTA